MGQICRLCLKVIIPKNNEYVSVHQTDNNGVAIATLVKALVPELYLGLSVNPVICPLCYDALRDAYSFRLQCLRSENLIGIFMRETHCSSVTIVLQDVVNYWMNVYKTKPCQSEVARANLAEWFGVEQSEETMQSKWAIKRRRKRVEFNKSALEELVRDDATKNDILEAKEDVSETENPKSPAEPDEEVSRLDSQEVEKSVEGKECSVDGSEPQKHQPSSLDKENDANTISETTKSPLKDICDCPPVDVCPTSELFKQKVHCKFQKMKEKQHAGCVDACEYRHKQPCKYYKPYSAIYSAQANDKLAADAISKNVLDSPTVIPPVKTYTKKQSAKSTEEVLKNTQDAREVAFPVQELSREEQTRLSSHEENNIENVLKQLQNNQNLENFNFINDELDIGQTHVIKRFPSKTGKCFSYALLPKSICDNAFDIVKKEKVDPFENNRIDSPTGQVGDASSISILKNKIQRMSENKMGSESFQTTEKDSAVVPEACSSHKSSDKEGEEHNAVGDKSVDYENNETPKPESSVAQPKLLEEKDEESLGIITFNSELSLPEQPRDRPMPMIRVRPVSSLQKIRTLNHELFPTPPETNKIQEMPPLIITQPLKIAKLPVGPPVVLNSKLLPGMNPTLLGSIVLPESADQPSSSQALKVVTKTYTKPLGAATRLMQVTLDHVKKMGINPLKLKKLKAVKPLRKLLPLESASQNGETISATPLNISDPIAGGSRGVSGLRDDEAIDIKEEPLDFGENDPLSEMDPFEGIPNGIDSWDGESTKDADETLFMDEMITDNLTQLIENIPAVVEEEFDEPEYVHINKVSFDDLTKLMKESKQCKKDSNQEKESFNLKTDTSRTSLLLAINEPQKLTRQDTSDPLHIPQRKARPKKKIGKRLRLVPVEVEEPQVPKKKRRRSSVAVEKHFSNDQQNVCVLFTNFTSDGDYINDHDYLVNPYTRNNMSIFKRKVDSCLCLLCDLVHPARSHIEHMRCHTTRCFICRIDFHNVFILNLHVRCHTSHCEECGVNVTYARYRHHAETHNKSPVLSNIYLPREDPPPKRRRTRAASSRGSDTSGTTKKSRRRTTRNSRSKNYENVELEDEEACIYNKATKSFVTPTLDKRQKQSARTNKKKAAEDKADISSTSDGTPQAQFVTLTSLFNDSDPADLNSNNSFNSNNSATNSEKATQQKAAAKTNKRRRKLYSERSRKKVKSEKVHSNKVSSQVTDNAANEPENKTTKTQKLVCDFGALRLSEGNSDDVNVASIGNPEAVAIKKSPAKKAFFKPVPESSSNASEILTNKPEIMENDNVLKPKIKAGIEANAVIKTKILIRKGHSIKSATLRRVSETQARKSLLARPRKDSLLKVKESASILSPKGVKSPLQDDVQVKIRCIKLHPLDIQEANKIESVLKSRFLEKKRKEQDNVAEAVSKEISDKVEAHTDNVSIQEFAERVQPSPSASKRSSRSRGSLNLVEGLKVDGPARSKKPRKSISSSLPSLVKRDGKRQTADPLAQPLEIKDEESSHTANVKTSERQKEDQQS